MTGTVISYSDRDILFSLLIDVRLEAKTFPIEECMMQVLASLEATPDG